MRRINGNLIVVRLRDEFENGKVYYAMEGTPLTLPASPQLRPAAAHQTQRLLDLFAQ